MDWQQIETAPKDGTEIIVWDGASVCVMAFDKGTTYDNFLSFCDESEGEKEWKEYCEENPAMGWTGNEPITGDWRYSEPTHWMPLPRPPEEHPTRDTGEMK